MDGFFSQGTMAFNLNGFFKAYIFALSAAKTNLFIDYFEQVVINS